MDSCDLTIALLMFTCAGLCGWCLWLHGLNDQKDGYIKRMENPDES